MTKCIAQPLSRMQIRKMAEAIRVIAHQENDLCFDIVKFLDVTLPKLDSKFNLIIEGKEVLGECHGLTYPDRNEIHIRDDVYERAYAGSGRDRLTMAHELFHLLQHVKENISYARVADDVEIEVFRDPEWQATAFGGELLIPVHLIKNMSVDEIADRCKVSYNAAAFQVTKM